MGTNVAIYALSFAFILYATQTLLNGQVIQGFFGVLLSLAMFWLGDPKVRIRVGKSLSHYTRAVDTVSNIGKVVLIIFVLYVFVRLVFHI